MNFGALKKAKNKIVTDVPPEAEAVTSNTGEYITEEVITTNVNEAFNDYLANDSPFVAQMTKKLNEQRQEAAKEEMQPPPYEPPYEQTYYNYNDIPFNDSDVPPEDEEQQYYAPPTEEDERRMWQQAEAYEREMAMQEEGRPFEEPSEAELAYIAEQEAARETADQYLDEALGRPDAVCSANPNICWDDAPHKEEREDTLLAEGGGQGHNLCSATETAHIDAAHVAVAQHLERLLGDAMSEEVVLDALTLGNDVGGTKAGEAVGQHQDSALEACCRREHESRKGMDTHRHPCQPRRHHAEQAGLGRQGMYHRRPLTAEHPDESP